MKILPGPRKYPKHLTIRGEHWEVKFARNLDKRADASSDESPILGLCEPDTKTIWIKLGQSKIDTLKTFVHEIVHAIEDEHGFTIPHGETIKDKTTGKERRLPDIVDKLERGITDVLLNNFI